MWAYFYNCDLYAAFLLNYGTIFTASTPKWITKWEGEGAKVEKYPEMVPSKLKDDITNQFFKNYISSCLGVLEAAFEVLHSLPSASNNSRKSSGRT